MPKVFKKEKDQSLTAMWECEYCGMCFISKLTYNMHMANAHQTKLDKFFKE